MILSFGLGLTAALARSDLSVPEAAAKALSIHLLFAIGFKGDAAVAANGLGGTFIATLVAGLVLSAILLFVAFWLLRVLPPPSAASMPQLWLAITGPFQS